VTVVVVVESRQAASCVSSIVMASSTSAKLRRAMNDLLVVIYIAYAKMDAQNMDKKKLHSR